MGALVVQFPRRKVRMFYWLYVAVGTFFLPVWLWGGLWFGREVFDLVVWGTGTGIAFGAHIGGFMFGAALAFAIIKIQGDPFEAKYGGKNAGCAPGRPPGRRAAALPHRCSDPGRHHPDAGTRRAVRHRRGAPGPQAEARRVPQAPQGVTTA